MVAERFRRAPLAVGGLGAIHLLEGAALGLFLWSMKDVADLAWAVRFPLTSSLAIGIGLLSAVGLCLAWGLVRGVGFPPQTALTKIVILNLPLLLLAGNVFQGMLNHAKYHGAYVGLLGVKVLLVIAVSAWAACLVALLSSLRLAAPRGKSASRLLPLLQSGLGLCMIVTGVYLFYHIETGLFRHQILEDLNRHLWVAGSGDVRMASTDPPYVTTIFWAHIYPVYALLGPLYRAVGGTIHTVVALQVSFFVLGAIPVFCLARKILQHDWAALSWAIAYLWYPPVHAALFRYGFYVDLLAMPFLLCALWALSAQRITLFWVWLVGFMLWKESTMPLLAALGLYLAIGRRWRWLGLGVMAASLAWLFAGMHIATAMNGGIFYNDLYQKTVLGWLQAPLTFFQFVIQPKNLANLALLLLPFGLLSVGSPFLLVSLPMFYVIAIHPASRYIWLPYYGILLPIFLIAALWTCRNVLARFTDRAPACTVRHILIALPLVSTIASYALLGPFSYYRASVDPAMTMVSERDMTIHRMALQIPAQASVAVSPWLHTLFDGRRWLYFWPVPVEKEEFARNGLRYDTPQTRDADYVVVDLHDSSGYLPGGAQNPAVKELLGNPAYGLVRYDDQVLMFQRGHTGTLRDMVLTREIPASEPLRVIDGSIALIRCEADRLSIAPGRLLRVRYVWRCLKTPQAPYAIWTRFVRHGDVLFSSLHEPLDGLWPMMQWSVGDTVRDSSLIRVPEDVVPTAEDIQMEVQLVRLTEASWMKAGGALVATPTW